MVVRSHVDNIDAIFVAQVTGDLVGDCVDADEVEGFVALHWGFLADLVSLLPHDAAFAKVVVFPSQLDARTAASLFYGSLAHIHQPAVHLAV